MFLDSDTCDDLEAEGGRKEGEEAGGIMEEPQRRRKRSPRGSHSPPPGNSGAGRSQSKRKNKSSNKKSKSPREKRSRSPHHVIPKVKQERDERSQRGHEERPHRDHSEPGHRQEKSNDRERHRDHSGRRKPHRDQPGGHERERDGHRFQVQQAQRELYNEQRRERREQTEASGEEENPGAEGSHSTDKEPGNKEKPSFELSGALLEDSNTFRGVVIKYSEPPEARIPKKRWRLYPFKNDKGLPVMYIHRQSAYLLGRHRRIADIPIDHPSCSKQHAVFQYRLVEYTRPDGTVGRKVKPYIIDLGSGNGTFLNNQRIEPQRYYELKEKDVLKFGFSSREYVLLHESSDTSEVDQKAEEEEEEEEEEST